MQLIAQKQVTSMIIIKFSVIIQVAKTNKQTNENIALGFHHRATHLAILQRLSSIVGKSF